MALVVAGSWGVGGISRTVSAVARCGYIPVTVCGRDERLRRRLVRMGVGIVIGWTDDMKRLMAAADVLVENAGGLTSMEAFAAGLPVVSYRPIAGHGRHNAREMDRAGVAHWARNSRSLADILNRLGSPGPERGLLTAQAGALFDGSGAVHLVESAASAPVPRSPQVLPRWMPSKAARTPALDHDLAVPQPSSFADQAPGALTGAGLTSSPAPAAAPAQPVDGRHRPRHLGPPRTRRGPAVAAIVATIAALVCGGLLLTGHPGRRRHHARRVTIVQTTPSVAAAPPVVGSLQAAWVVGENRRAGSSAWRLSGVSGGAAIEGYADHTSARVGQTVGLFVSTAASSYHVSAFRMGYYGGLGGRLVWSSPVLGGVKQAGCGLRAETNMVECSWSVSVSVPIDGSWLPGAYLFKLSADGGEQSYVPLTVWDPASHAALVIQSSVLTWQAWNDYGGYSNFGGLSPPAKGAGRAGGDRAFADRARVLSFDRPYAKSSGASDFLALELPLIGFAEQRGLDVTYWTDIDLSENPQLLVNHKALLSLGHNEFVTGPERQAEVDGLAQGVNLAFLGATPDLRPARLQASPLGADREEVAYRDPLQDPLTRSDPQAATANTWAQPPLDKPASRVVGDTYGGYGINAALVVTTPGAWPFAGTGLGAGAQLQHVILGDYDNYQPGQDSPANVEILAHSPVHTSYGHHGTADMTYYTDPASHAGVFATGTIGWIPSLLACPPTTNPTDCPADAVATITTNVLHLFGTGPAGTTQPSTPNWKGYHI